MTAVNIFARCVFRSRLQLGYNKMHRFRDVKI